MASTDLRHCAVLGLALACIVAQASCASDCDELSERCRDCGTRLGRSDAELDYVCGVGDNEDACEQALETTGGCPFLDEDMSSVCDCG